MTIFLISALRAVIEMLGLCYIGQAILYALAGSGRAGNPIYRLFDLITRLPRRLLAALMPASVGSASIAIVSFLILLLAWIGLAFVRMSI